MLKNEFGDLIIDMEHPSLHPASRSSIRPPPFWPRNPACWFLQLESYFNTSKIFDDNMQFDLVVQTLESSVVERVQDLLETRVPIPGLSLYQTMKSRLLREFALTEGERVAAFNQAVLGDKRPSGFLRDLQRYAGDNFPPSTVRHYFIRGLPAYVQATLIARPDLRNEDLAFLADNIMLTISHAPKDPPQVILSTQTSAPAIASTTTTTTTASSDFTRESQLEKTIRGLQETVAALRRTDRHPTSSSPAKDSVCWYHTKFGNRAKRCNQPCAHSKNEAGQPQ